MVENQIEKYRVEYLLLSQTNRNSGWGVEGPHYEKYGSAQVSAGHYKDVIRYRQHFVPLMEAFKREIAEGL